MEDLELPPYGTIPSPALLFYKDRISHNIDQCIELVGGPSHLRPHIKTHKTRELVRMKMDRGILDFKAATLAEAEVLCSCGVREAVLAYPLVGPNIQLFFRLRAHYPDTRLQAIVDSLEAARELSAAARSQDRLELWLDLDVGMHRTGIDPSLAAELYLNLIDLPGLRPIGIHAYDGHNAQPHRGERLSAAKGVLTCLAQIMAELEGHGQKPRLILGGSPNFDLFAELLRTRGWTSSPGGIPQIQLSPGTFVLQDQGYADLFPDQGFLPAAFLLTRVVSLNRERRTFTLDLGSKAIACDPPGVRGRIWGLEENQAIPLFQSEEHWVHEARNMPMPEIGDEFLVVPTHICPSVALYDRALVLDGKGRVKESWQIAARRRDLEI